MDELYLYTGVQEGPRCPPAHDSGVVVRRRTERTKPLLCYVSKTNRRTQQTRPQKDRTSGREQTGFPLLTLRNSGESPLGRGTTVVSVVT